jgi:hypothetical protein
MTYKGALAIAIISKPSRKRRAEFRRQAVARRLQRTQSMLVNEADEKAQTYIIRSRDKRIQSESVRSWMAQSAGEQKSAAGGWLGRRCSTRDRIDKSKADAAWRKVCV